MVRHVVILTLIDAAGEGDRAAILDALADLPSKIPEIRSYLFGADLGLDPTSADIAVVADFDDLAGFETYRDHEAHKAVIETFIRPVLAARTASQFVL